jgi:exportin-T
VDTPHEAARNTMMKDTMRDSCVAKLVESWFHILVIYLSSPIFKKILQEQKINCGVNSQDTYQNSQPALAGRCLQVIGAYISWIDINLVVNDQFFPLLVQQLSRTDLREDTADCLLFIVTKGMEPLQKMKLVESLSNILDAANVLNPQNVL